MEFDFETAIAEIIDVPGHDGNPFQTIAKFVFADDQPNGNGQAIPVDEFDSIIASAIGMPVKMKFTGSGPDSHEGSVPIGVIKSMIKETKDDINRLVAEAVLWTAEFPKEVAWLKEQFAEAGNDPTKKLPGLSWELRYKESEKTGAVEWLRKIIATAATFVRNPAYGSRTALLALASMNDNPDELKQLPQEAVDSILAIAEQLKTANPNDKGGKKVEEELQKAKAEAEEFKNKLAEVQAELDLKTTEISTLTTENTTLKEQIASHEKAVLASERVRLATEAGIKIEEKDLEERKNYLVSLSEDQFKIYIADVKAIAATKVATASLGGPRNDFPRLDPIVPNETVQTLRQAMRSLARPNSVE